MRGIMADVCGKEEGAERRLRHAHVNGSLMKQYDRCIIEILPHPPSPSSPCSYRSLAIRVSVFSPILRSSIFHPPPPPLAGSMCLCPLMANSSSLTAHNFLDAITKDGIRDRDDGEKRRCSVRAQSSELLTSIFFKFLHDGYTETIG